MERARAMLRGLVPRPPLGHLLGLRVTQVGSGTATMTMPASPWVQGYDGRLLYNTLMEAASATAVLTGTAPGADVDTTSISISYFRPCTPQSETIIARARTINSGPTFTHTEVVTEDALGRLLSQTTMAAVVRPAAPPAGLPAGLAPVPEPTYPTPDPHKKVLPDGVGPVPHEILQALDGLTLLRRVLQGDLPRAPLLELFGVGPSLVELGRVRLEVPATEWLSHRRGEIAPGVLFDLVGMSAWAALVTTAPTGGKLGTPGGNAAVLRTAEADGRRLMVDGWVADRQGDTLVAAATISDASGRRIAMAQLSGLLQPFEPQPAQQAEAALLTIVFTDLVASTQTAERLGDQRWRDVLAAHHALVRHELEVAKGQEVKTTGDGFLATFDTPVRALRFAVRLRDVMRQLGLQLRVGIHTGHCQISAGDVAGIAVHVAARVLAAASAGEILVSGTVRDLLLGSDFKFEDRGHHHLKGIDGEWQLFALVG